MKEEIDYSALCKQVAQVAAMVGDYIAAEAASFDMSRIQFKERHDLVSYVDVEAERRIVNLLKPLLPSADFLGEESGAAHTQSGSVYKWIIDPLDGTTNFIHRIPHYAVSIALECAGTIVLGVVYDIPQKAIYRAVWQAGAFKNEVPLRVNTTAWLDDAVLATGFSNTNRSSLEPYLATLGKVLLRSRAVRRLGAASLDLVYTAEGIFDGFFEQGLQPWDVAAGILIVNEANGYCTDFGGQHNDLIYKGQIVASNKLLHTQLLQCTTNW
jgi:myo-inositol-1(or 4)-monophosphatase